MNERPYSASESQPARSSEQVWRMRGRVLNVIGVIVVLGVLLALLAPAIQLRPNSHSQMKAQCINQLKQVGLAMLNYESKYGAFPPAYTVDANGNRLHSWRALILPFIEQQHVYATIDFSKPWDDPANLKAFQTGLPFYQCPSIDCPETHTNYFVVVAADGVFSGAEARKMAEITDQDELTLLAVESDASHHVHWMSPRDVDETWLQSIGKIDELPHGKRLAGVVLDGRHVLLESDMSPQRLRAMITIAGGDDAIASQSD